MKLFNEKYDIRKPMKEYVHKLPTQYLLRNTLHIPSVGEGAGIASRSSIMERSYTMPEEDRELIQSKAEQLVPAFSKGAYTVVTQDTVKEVGRKL